MTFTYTNIEYLSYEINSYTIFVKAFLSWSNHVLIQSLNSHSMKRIVCVCVCMCGINATPISGKNLRTKLTSWSLSDGMAFLSRALKVLVLLVSMVPISIRIIVSSALSFASNRMVTKEKPDITCSLALAQIQLGTLELS